MKTFRFFLILLFITNLQISWAQQVGINTTTPDASAVLDVVATDKGVLIPRLTTIQRNGISNPATGLLVFDTTSNSFWYYEGATWLEIGNANTLSDGDKDTKIQMNEGNNDQDIIRFDLDGTEQWVMTSERLEEGNMNNNIFVGKNAGLNEIGSARNVIIGSESGQANTIGSENVYLGYNAGTLSTRGSNTFVGAKSGEKNTLGEDNTFVGHATGANNESGKYNTFLGRLAGVDNIGGDNNTYLGYNANSNFAANLDNVTAIGANSVATSNNSFILGGTGANAVRVGIGNTSPDASAVLEITATDKGILIPRMTTAERNAISNPAMALQVYDITTASFWYYDGSTWLPVSGSTAIANLIEDSGDGDTKVQVDSLGLDDDVIRFDVNGVEQWVMQSSRLAEGNMNNNIFVGKNTGLNELGSIRNIFIGSETGKSNTIGSENVYLGYNAGTLSTEGANTFIGAKSGEKNTIGSDNTFVGHATGTNNADGKYNTFLGRLAGADNTGGDNNTFIGYNSNSNFVADLENVTAIGANSVATSDNSFILGGTGANAVRVGIGNTSPDASAVLEITATDKGILIPRMTTTERNAISNPATALQVYDTTTGSFWYYEGSAWTEMAGGAGIATLVKDGGDGDTKIQTDETGIDDDVIRFDIDGTEQWVMQQDRIEPSNSDHNLFVGQNVGSSNTPTGINAEGTGNTFLGADAGVSNTKGAFNTFVGISTGVANSLGRANTFIGANVGAANLTGMENTFVGTAAGNSNLDGSYNSFFGNGTGISNTSGNDNTFIGYNAGVFNESGSNNTFIGDYSGAANVSGYGNVFIGSKAGSSETGNDKLFIENSDATTPLVWGDFANDQLGVNRIATTNTLEVGGTLSTSDGLVYMNSDSRLKKNIQKLESERMLQKLLALQGVNYEWNDDKTNYNRPAGTRYGFIAQNIEKVFPEFVQEDAQGYLQTSYGTYDPIYVEAIRALYQRIEVLETKNKELQTQLNDLESLKAVVKDLQQNMAR